MFQGDKWPKRKEKRVDDALISHSLTELKMIHRRLEMEGHWPDLMKQRKNLERTIIEELQPIIRETAKTFLRNHEFIFRQRRITVTTDDLEQDIREVLLDDDENLYRNWHGEGKPITFLITVFHRKLLDRYVVNQLTKKRTAEVMGLSEVGRDRMDDVVDHEALEQLERTGSTADKLHILDFIDDPIDCLICVLDHGLGRQMFWQVKERVREELERLKIPGVAFGGRVKKQDHLARLRRLLDLCLTDDELEKEHTDREIGEWLGMGVAAVNLRKQKYKKILKERIKQAQNRGLKQ